MLQEVVVKRGNEGFSERVTRAFRPALGVSGDARLEPGVSLLSACSFRGGRRHCGLTSVVFRLSLRLRQECALGVLRAGKGKPGKDFSCRADYVRYRSLCISVPRCQAPTVSAARASLSNPMHSMLLIA